MGGKSSQATQQITIPPEVLARYNAVNARAETTAQRPYQIYSTDPSAFVAPLSPTQQAGIAGTNYYANAAQPYYGAAVGQLGAGRAIAQPYYDAATGNVTNAQDIGNYYANQSYGALSGAQAASEPYYQGAQSAYQTGYASAQPYNQIAGQFGLAGAQAVNPADLDQAAIQKYMSPYVQNVLEGTQGMLNQTNQQAMAGQLGNAIRQGAFGGDRGGIAAANLAQSQRLADAKAFSDILNQGYSQALGTAAGQQQLGYSAAAANRAAQQQAAQQMAALGQQNYAQGIGYGQAQQGLGAQRFSQRLSEAQQLAALGQQQFGQGLTAAQQQAALGAGLYGMDAQTAQALAALGVGAQGAGLQGAQAQLAAGQGQQATEQAGLQALYNQFLQQQSYPFQVAQFLANIAMGTGALSGSTTTTNQSLGGGFSDKRLKENIRQVGKTFDGQNIYSYNFKGSPQTEIGLLAQEVEKKHPEAVGLAAGYKTVRYDKATDDAADRGKFGLGGASMGGGVGPENFGEGYADGGFAGFDPGLYAQIAQMYENMYAPMSGGKGLAAGYVPEPIASNAQLMTAPGLDALQPDRTLEQMAASGQLSGGIGGLGGKLGLWDYTDEQKKESAAEKAAREEARTRANAEQAWIDSQTALGDAKMATGGLAGRKGYQTAGAVGGNDITVVGQKADSDPEEKPGDIVVQAPKPAPAVTQPNVPSAAPPKIDIAPIAKPIPIDQSTIAKDIEKVGLDIPQIGNTVGLESAQAPVAGPDASGGVLGSVLGGFASSILNPIGGALGKGLTKKIGLKDGGEVNPLGWQRAHVTSGFGERRSYENHPGVDFAVPGGTPIGSVADGIVQAAGFDKVNGNHVFVRHSDGTLASYAHLGELGVEPGQRVNAGTILGLSGNTGRVRGAGGGYHLHFGMRDAEGNRINPMAYLGGERPIERSGPPQIVKAAMSRINGGDRLDTASHMDNEEPMAPGLKPASMMTIDGEARNPLLEQIHRGIDPIREINESLDPFAEHNKPDEEDIFGLTPKIGAPAPAGLMPSPLAKLERSPEPEAVNEAKPMVPIGTFRGDAPIPTRGLSPRGAGTIARRQNNPGNLIDNEYTRGLPGYKGASGGFAIFESPEAGRAAQMANLQSYLRRGYDTPWEIAHRWAPAKDPRNNPKAYAEMLAKHLGIGVNDTVSPDQLNRLADMQGRIEGYAAGGLAGRSGYATDGGVDFGGGLVGRRPGDRNIEMFENPDPTIATLPPPESKKPAAEAASEAETKTPPPASRRPLSVYQPSFVEETTDKPRRGFGHRVFHDPETFIPILNAIGAIATTPSRGLGNVIGVGLGAYGQGVQAQRGYQLERAKAGSQRFAAETARSALYPQIMSATAQMIQANSGRIDAVLPYYRNVKAEILVRQSGKTQEELQKLHRADPYYRALVDSEAMLRSVIGGSAAAGVQAPLNGGLAPTPAMQGQPAAVVAPTPIVSGSITNPANARTINIARELGGEPASSTLGNIVQNAYSGTVMDDKGTLSNTPGALNVTAIRQATGDVVTENAKIITESREAYNRAMETASILRKIPRITGGTGVGQPSIATIRNAIGAFFGKPASELGQSPQEVIAAAQALGIPISGSDLPEQINSILDHLGEMAMRAAYVYDRVNKADRTKPIDVPKINEDFYKQGGR